jgi:hypothetical protein
MAQALGAGLVSRCGAAVSSLYSGRAKRPGACSAALGQRPTWQIKAERNRQFTID